MFAICRNRGCLYRVLQPAAKISNRTRALYQGERAFLKQIVIHIFYKNISNTHYLSMQD